MTRAVSVGRSKGFLLLSTLGTALLASTLLGCPGTLDPGQFPPSGAATGGTPGGGTPGGGTTGTGGTTGGTFPGCDISALIAPGVTTYSCQLAGCHDPNTTNGLDMVTAGWEARLVGAVPKGGATSVCANDATYKTMPYIVKGSNPATGLLLTKLMKKACVGGNQMPTLNGPVKPADMTCFQKWADKLANTTP